ncbi:MAG: hypothetical protein IJ189_05850 [Clostridia bacterium]|nr:hypothetical protein [Clostridia bacterium]
MEEARFNSTWGVSVRLTDADGGVYTVDICYPLHAVICATYRDAAHQACVDA